MTTYEKIKVKCSLCGSDRSQKIFFKDGFDIVECEKCKLIYVNPRLSPKELKNFYTKEYYISSPEKARENKGYLDYLTPYTSGREKRFETLLDAIETKTQVGKILDIGCATGFLLQEAKKRGWETKGVEISEWASEYAKEKLGLDVLNDNLFNAKFQADYFDVITMADLLEHVQDPLKELEEANRILKEGGIIFIETVNFNFFTRKMMGAKWGHMVPIGHLTYFTKESLRKMLDKANFKIISMKTWSTVIGKNKYFLIGYITSLIKFIIASIVYMMLRLTKIKIKYKNKDIFSVLPGYKEYFKKQISTFAINDVVEVYARKTSL